MENTSEPPDTTPPTIGCWDNHPDWNCKNNPPYVKTPWPSDIQAYVVCLGRAGAAWHKYCDQVAKGTSGPSAWHVYQTRSGTTTAATSASQLSLSAPSEEALAAIPDLSPADAFAHPTTLPVRLYDAYLDMGQISHRWPRMFEWTARISPNLEYVEVPFDVEENLPAMYVTVEWDDPAAGVNAGLLRPDGTPVDPSDPDVIYHRQDNTHFHWGIREPRAAEWKVTMMAERSLAEVLVTVSGPSDIIMRLLIDPDDTFVYEEIEICTLLTDNEPIPASSPAAVAANVIDPAGEPHWMWLFDDGYHEDGAANDGVFCDRYPGVDLPGVYQIKGLAAGAANDGRPFQRRAMGYTYREPQVLHALLELPVPGFLLDVRFS